jgi:hypothetical protein
MKSILNISLLGFLLALFFVSCKKIDVEPDNIPIYSNYNDIINPPDSFKVLYNLRSNINYLAEIKFSENAVWLIEKQNHFTTVFWAARPEDDSVVNITSTIVVGLETDKTYEFYANNNYSLEARKLLIKYTKTNYNYDTFANKF